MCTSAARHHRRVVSLGSQPQERFRAALTLLRERFVAAVEVLREANFTPDMLDVSVVIILPLCPFASMVDRWQQM
jgi:hypothetical protein